MRFVKSFFVALLALFAAVAVTPSAHASSTAAGGKYVALGDSYAVGVGTRTYDNPNDACRRGPLSYTRLWAAQHTSTAFVEASCSGARTADVINSQVPQLTSDTTLVTVQVGGNDVGFVDVLKTCILTINDNDCVNAVNAAKAAATSSLPAKLDQTYDAIHAKAPNARVIVVGYPRIYTIAGNCGIFGLSDTERTALNSAADTLAGVESGRAGAHGFTYLDPRTAFQPHTLCSGGSEWTTSLEWSKLDESYHPNAAGHRDGYLPLLNGITG